MVLEAAMVLAGLLLPSADPRAGHRAADGPDLTARRRLVVLALLVVLSGSPPRRLLSSASSWGLLLGVGAILAVALRWLRSTGRCAA